MVIVVSSKTYMIYVSDNLLHVQLQSYALYLLLLSQGIRLSEHFHLRLFLYETAINYQTLFNYIILHY